ncbi:hypothetical protein AB0454_22830 [Streptomyces sp. NPDC093509]|uniref:hypothetical protein n=1 Tax=Streptomyces sp. NPDC093509 TaxID=3154982 RepID=UPI00344E4265
MDVRSELRFQAQVHEDSKRTLLCAPETLCELQAAIEQRGMAHLWTAAANPTVPEGQIVILDEQALEAVWQQTLQRVSHQGIRLHGDAYYRDGSS